MKDSNKIVYYSTIEVARLLGVSRVTIFLWIKNGKLPAVKIGRNYAIEAESLRPFVDRTELTSLEKDSINHAVEKAVKEYKETFRLLGKE